MPRIARAVAVGCVHHITQRGNARQAIFVSSVLCDAYLDLLKEHAGRFGMRIVAFCLMTNHVHIVAIPEEAKSLASTLRHAHSRFAQTGIRCRGETDICGRIGSTRARWMRRELMRR